jgi:endonuclease/exonuclease/phosphatase family metal-dependent hydrolase
MAIKLKKLILNISRGVKYTIFATNLIAIVLLVLATKAQTVAPSHNIFISYLGMGFPILLLINIAYLFLWVISFQWKFIIVQLIAFVMCIDAITTYIPINNRTDNVPEDAIKVMSYNVRGFDWLTGKDARKNPILEYIANSGADIICLQEFAVEKWQDRRKIISLKEFDNIMKDYPYRSVIRLGDTENSTIYGLACYSKYPIKKVARVPIESAFNGSAMYEIRIGKKDITVVNNHLESNRLTAEDKELYKELVLNKNKEMIDEVTQSIQDHLDPAFKARESQADIIADCIRQQRKHTKSMIICGDFNEPPISYTYQKIKGDFLDSYKVTGRGMGITYHENMFWFRIDYIMYTPNLKSYNCTVGDVKYSDHYPIWTYISL